MRKAGSTAQLAFELRKRRRAKAKQPALEGREHVVVGLFAGIGGLELGLHRANHSTVLLCESDPAALEVLEARFPKVRKHEDVRDLTELPKNTSLVVAGFPCQDLSQAGATKGISGERSGLVGRVFELLENNDVPWVLLENVPFMLQLARGEAMLHIVERLESLGYKWAYRVVDARAFGLPQRRRRVYLVASRDGDPRSILFADEAGEPEETQTNGHQFATGFYWTEGLRGLGWAVDAVPTLKGGSTIGIPSPPAILLPDGRVVTPDLRDAERLQGFPKNWTKPAERVAKKGARWKLVGNAVSVPAAAWIGRRLKKPGAPLEFDTHPMHGHRHWPTAAWNVDGVRMTVEASEWPVRYAYKSLEAFLKHEPQLLSAKATAGFLERAARAKLNYKDKVGFLDALRLHLRRVSKRGEVSLEVESDLIARAA
jgi:DNA (cytosine-5)-methyltransferase 1